MDLPHNCKRITRDERLFPGQAQSQRYFDKPFFAVYHDSFLDVIGEHPEVVLGVEKDWPFAHEAGVYFPDQDVVFVTSNGITTDEGRKIKVGKISRQHGQWEYEEIKTGVTMGNGGINYQGGVLFCDQGNKTSAGGLVLMEAQAPWKHTPLLSSYHYRQFNSVNDVVVHTEGSIWFTDPIYGFEQGFRDAPQLPCQVYVFHPKTGDIRVVADGFGRPNGLCFSPDEQTMYITDTDWIHGDGTIDMMRPSTIYAFDVIERHSSRFLANRRLFAMSDEGMPDGIKCDLAGNVYSGCGDGVNIWSPGGTLIGKVKVPGGVANFCFGRKGEMFLLNETRFWVVKLRDSVQGALLANMKIDL